MTQWIDVGVPDDFQEEAGWPVRPDGHAVVVFRLDGSLYALRDLCTHGAALLSEGFVEDGCIECPLHQGKFDIRTGAPMCKPVTVGVATYAVKEVDGRVMVEVGE